MKTKHFLLTLLLASFASGTLGQYRYNVTNKSEFTDALAQIATLPKGSAAYIYIYPEMLMRVR